jgi:prepilin-type N-terminal cleavage/methylation domain-containing protein
MGVAPSCCLCQFGPGRSRVGWSRIRPLGGAPFKWASGVADMTRMQRLTPSLRVFRPRARLAGDAGLSLIELVFAMVIFAIIASGVIAGLAASMKTARLDKNRAAATNLASRELEITRNEFKGSNAGPAALAAANYVVNPHPLPGQTAGTALLVDGIP